MGMLCDGIWINILLENKNTIDKSEQYNNLIKEWQFIYPCTFKQKIRSKKENIEQKQRKKRNRNEYTNILFILNVAGCETESNIGTDV